MNEQRTGAFVANQVPLARILWHSALELLLTFCMLFGVASIVRWVIGPSPISRMLPEIHAELLIVGLAVAIFVIARESISGCNWIVRKNRLPLDCCFLNR